MNSKKQEERNEMIIRGLMKLPPNRRCINCNSMGPQYVCTNFWTFVCIACSGIHREFTHRVKSVSMSNFTVEEVKALQRGGNQCAREMFLREWDTHKMRLPNSSNPEKIRAFIKDVYVNRKYAASEKLPRNLPSAASSSSFGSFDSNSLSFKSVNSSIVTDAALVPEHSTRAFPSFSRPSASSQIKSQPLPATTTSEINSSGAPITKNEGWATFDLPHNNSLWFPFHSSTTGPFLTTTGQQNVGLQECRTPADQDSHALFKDELQKLTLDGAISGPNLPFNIVDGLSVPSSVAPSAVEGVTSAKKSINPFDLPYDTKLDINNAFPEMSSLQATLPNPQVSASHGSIQPWGHENLVPAFIWPQLQDGLENTGSQAPSSQFPAPPSSNPFASSGGNPFA